MEESKTCEYNKHEFKGIGKEKKCIKCGLMPNFLIDFFSIPKRIGQNEKR